jgi:non-specific serine/threonine protein kinase
MVQSAPASRLPARKGRFPVEECTANHNLPHPSTRFVGREREIAAIQEYLTTTRLLTLTGAGGCGKSRLALEVAHARRHDPPDGVWLAELASLADPALLPRAVATVLDVRERPGEALIDTLVGALRPKCLLLVLDNCEHLLAGCVTLVDALLRGCPDLRILTTSREALGMLGETTYRVPGLSLPPVVESHELRVERLTGTISSDAPTLNSQPSSLNQSEAVRLFVARAVAVEPSFELTPRMPERWPGSAGNWMGFRWLSRWRRPASGRSRWRHWPSAWATVSAC